MLPITLGPLDRGVPGAGARAERQRRTDRREDALRAAHPRIGGFRFKVSRDPTSTTVWDRGAEGEELVGAWLEKARPRGIEVLHDRSIPRSRANIDHLVIAPSGVWVVDAKHHRDKRLEHRDVGGLFKTDRRLYVGGRDQTRLVEGIQKQMAIVDTFLHDIGFTRVPVRGALCFVHIKTDWFARPFRVDGVFVTWRKHLVAPMLSPAILDTATRLALTHQLAAHFKHR